MGYYDDNDDEAQLVDISALSARFLEQSAQHCLKLGLPSLASHYAFRANQRQPAESSINHRSQSQSHSFSKSFSISCKRCHLSLAKTTAEHIDRNVKLFTVRFHRTARPNQRMIGKLHRLSSSSRPFDLRVRRRIVRRKRSLPMDRLLPLTIVYTIIFIVGLVGNLTTCIVIRKHPVLQTQTNRYLLNLALADLLTLTVGLPFEIYMNWNQYPWHFPDFACHLKAWLAETTTCVSVLTILLFSVERYFAICHTLLFVKLEPLRSRLPLLLGIIWGVSLASALPYGIYHRADYLIPHWPTLPDSSPVFGSKMCMLALYFDENISNNFDLLMHLSALIFFVIPVIIIFTLYIHIAKKVNRQRTAMQHRCGVDNGGGCGSSSQDANSQRVTVLLTAVVIAFFVCYAPFQLQRLLFFYIRDVEIFQLLNHHLYFISGVLFYLATVVNPVLYNLMSSKFRRAFKEVLLAACAGQSSKYYHHHKPVVASNNSNASLLLSSRAIINNSNNIGDGNSAQQHNNPTKTVEYIARIVRSTPTTNGDISHSPTCVAPIIDCTPSSSLLIKWSALTTDHQETNRRCSSNSSHSIDSGCSSMVVTTLIAKQVDDTNRALLPPPPPASHRRRNESKL